MPEHKASFPRGHGECLMQSLFLFLFPTTFFALSIFLRFYIFIIHIFNEIDSFYFDPSEVSKKKFLNDSENHYPFSFPKKNSHLFQFRQFLYVLRQRLILEAHEEMVKTHFIFQ